MAKRSKLRDSARGQECQVRVPGYCNFNNETVVLCHLSGGGMAYKQHDIHGAYACSSCHSVLDGATKTEYDPRDIKIWHYDGLVRTQLLMIQQDLITA